MWLLIVSVLIDQISKYLICNMQGSLEIIPNLLSLNFVENYGAVFGLMQGSNYIMAIISTILCSIIVMYIVKSRKEQEKVHIAWYMILAGGIGNLIDRIFRGYVVDFIATPFIATFNIADSMVVIGVSMLLINELIDLIKSKKNLEK